VRGTDGQTDRQMDTETVMCLYAALRGKHTIILQLLPRQPQ